MTTYTTREAEGRLGEILRKVQEGERVVLVEEGKDVAEILPLSQEEDREAPSVEEALREFEEQGVILPATAPRQPFVPAGKRLGALRWRAPTFDGRNQDYLGKVASLSGLYTIGCDSQHRTGVVS